MLRFSDARLAMLQVEQLSVVGFSVVELEGLGFIFGKSQRTPIISPRRIPSFKKPSGAELLACRRLLGT